MKYKLAFFVLLFVNSVFANPNDRTHWVNIGEGTFHQGFIFPYKIKLYIPYGVRNIDDIKEGVIPMKFDLDWLLVEPPIKDVKQIFSNQIRDNYSNPESYRLGKNIIGLFLKHLPSVKKHDHWVFEYYPDEGTKLYINNEIIHHLIGAELNRALIQSWLNKSPVLTSNLFTRLLKLQ